jgi:hypothetical protein
LSAITKNFIHAEYSEWIGNYICEKCFEWEDEGVKVSIWMCRGLFGFFGGFNQVYEFILGLYVNCGI